MGIASIPGIYPREYEYSLGLVTGTGYNIHEPIPLKLGYKDVISNYDCLGRIQYSIMTA